MLLLKPKFMYSCMWMVWWRVRSGVDVWTAKLAHHFTRRKDASGSHAPPIFATQPIPPQQIQIMALLVDKHRPRNLEALSYHPELSDRLRALVRKPTTSFGRQSTTNAALYRHKAVTFHIFSYMVPLAQARKHELSQRSKSSTGLV
jgi:hypothetical protein